jgi:thioredoxin 1
MDKGGKLMKKSIFIIILVIASALSVSSIQAGKSKPSITFIELGSTTCIPCKKMQPIMKSIEEKYGNQVKVIFYDVNKKKSAIKKYKVRLIPTQVFLDSKGKEVHRHEGFYPEEDIDKFLESEGLKPKDA